MFPRVLDFWRCWFIWLVVHWDRIQTRTRRTERIARSDWNGVFALMFKIYLVLRSFNISTIDLGIRFYSKSEAHVKHMLLISISQVD